MPNFYPEDASFKRKKNHETVSPLGTSTHTHARFRPPRSSHNKKERRRKNNTKNNPTKKKTTTFHPPTKKKKRKEKENHKTTGSSTTHARTHTHTHTHNQLTRFSLRLLPRTVRAARAVGTRESSVIPAHAAVPPVIAVVHPGLLSVDPPVGSVVHSTSSSTRHQVHVIQSTSSQIV